MLAKNPNERYDADSLLKEDYFRQNLDESVDEEKAGKGFLNVVNSISTFTVGKNLRKSVMSYIIVILFNMIQKPFLNKYLYL